MWKREDRGEFERRGEDAGAWQNFLAGLQAQRAATPKSSHPPPTPVLHNLITAALSLQITSLKSYSEAQALSRPRGTTIYHSIGLY